MISNDSLSTMNQIENTWLPILSPIYDHITQITQFYQITQIDIKKKRLSTKDIHLINSDLMKDEHNLKKLPPMHHSRNSIYKKRNVLH